MTEIIKQLKIARENDVKFIPLIKTTNPIFNDKITLKFINNDGDLCYIPIFDTNRKLNPFESYITPLSISDTQGNIFRLSNTYYKYLKTAEKEDLSDWNVVTDNISSGDPDFFIVDEDDVEDHHNGSIIRGNHAVRLDIEPNAGLSPVDNYSVVANQENPYVDHGDVLRTWLYFTNRGRYALLVHGISGSTNFEGFQNNSVALVVDNFKDKIILKDADNGNTSKSETSFSANNYTWYYLELYYEPGNHSARIKTPNSGIISLNLNSSKFTGSDKFIGLYGKIYNEDSDAHHNTYWDEIGIGKKL